MALDFPANPSDGEVFGSYVWSTSKGVWQAREESATVAVTSPVPPTSPNSGDIWFDSSDGISYVYYDDGNTGQWVEMISSGVVSLASKADLEYVNSIDSRVSDVESSDLGQNSRLNSLEANVSTILNQSGYYTRQFIVETDTADRSFGTGWTLVYTGANRTGFKAGSIIRFTYQIPFRNESTSWGGAYTEPQVSFNNSTWITLGSSGYDGNVMELGSQSIATYTKSILINPSLQGVNTDFQFRFRFYCRSYDGTALWNQSHDINGVSGTATNASGLNLLQHYATFHIEELAVIA
jgi:hypothetical protein